MPEIIAWVVSFVVVTVAVSGLAGRVGWSAPVALVAVGAALSFVPGVPQLVIEPDAVLYGLLPPLLFAAAIRTPLADIRARRDSIVVLSVGVVVFTLLAFGLTLWALVPAVGLAAALALGAVVAPTDAVAVSAVAGRVKLPRRVMSILETESLLNDATALVALNTAIAAIVGVVHPIDVAGGFLVAVLLGVAIGLAVAFLFSAVRRYLRSAVLDTSLSLAIPYVAFIPAQELGGSGVLAVVAAGLVLGYRSPLIQSPEARIAESVNWRTIQFLLENAVFLIIGLSLAGILRDLPESSLDGWAIAGLSILLLAVLAAARFASVALAKVLFDHGPARLRARTWTWRTVTAVSSAGVRGVVTLAAAFLLPEETPERELLQFLAFVMVAGTLVGGLALPAIIRRLRLGHSADDQERSDRDRLLDEAREAGLAARAVAMREDGADDGPGDDALPETTTERLTHDRVRRRMIDAERVAVLAARREGRYPEIAVRAVLGMIDAEDVALGRREADDAR
ncbi:cation:proton antiporter [Clavibacter phaseoli]|jgi:CPA1 family monovalent cation:H+ antiporter|uniref:cation:proton antiporter n=1 Tax=Clavibacter phaseoli TaxID=1734031 RepID=UPI000E664EFE|nr:sodium:proton antiporter [Clavibacter phaseoli]MBM7388766.1 CPA1 family monovalent cation:H+ antiporter [Clavibacter michiganensis]RIJ53905.1 sodium:proton antiporter [Clavibacter phaseoli]UKF30952.1 sodium:proton antiporter [Clavibacter phaseoli]UKF36870.1 sodium:proton antiporter [Clavibacter phaseoli]